MTLEDLVALAGATLSRYLPMVIVLSPNAYLAWHWVKRRRDQMQRHEKADTMGPAFMVW